MVCYDPDFIMGKIEKQKEKRVTINHNSNITVALYTKWKMENIKAI